MYNLMVVKFKIISINFFYFHCQRTFSENYWFLVLD